MEKQLAKDREAIRKNQSVVDRCLKMLSFLDGAEGYEKKPWFAITVSDTEEGDGYPVSCSVDIPHEDAEMVKDQFRKVLEKIKKDCEAKIAEVEGRYE